MLTVSLHPATAADVVQDLQEDLATRWVPDVLADVDLYLQLERRKLDADDLRFVEVPKAGGGYRRAPVLSGAALGLLRRGVLPLREVADVHLDPAVCGYRKGSSGDASYSDEYRRFREMSSALATDHAYVVTADVARFFESVDLAAVRGTMADRFGLAWNTAENCMQQLASLGLQGLPAGYGDGRLLANLILSHADAKIAAPFTRWVDDYRIFVNSRQEGELALAELESGLGDVGLSLNAGKCRVLTSEEFLHRRLGVPLDSVYHPQDESANVVRANLRSVFLRAISAGDRRTLRFALPRLGDQRDDIAVEYVLHALQRPEIDAPRMVQYLSAFLDSGSVTDKIQSLVQHHHDEPWNLLRLSPLLSRIDLSADTVETLGRILQVTSSPVLWGAVLRTLSANNESDLVQGALSSSSSIPDPRAAVAAHVDLGQRIPPGLRARAAETVEVVEELFQAPLPRMDSIL